MAFSEWSEIFSFLTAEEIEELIANIPDNQAQLTSYDVFPTQWTFLDSSIQVTWRRNLFSQYENFSFYSDIILSSSTGASLIGVSPIGGLTTELSDLQTVLGEFKTYIDFQISSITAGDGLYLTGTDVNIGTVSASRIVVNANDIDLATTGVTPGTFSRITIDDYGRATAGGDISGTANQISYDTGTGILSLPQDIDTSSTPSFAGLTLTDDLNFDEGINIIIGTSTGTVIGQTGAKVAFLGATASLQQTGGSQTAGGTYGSTEQDMLQKAYDALRTFGFLS